MTLIYIAIILLQVGVIVYFIRRGRKQAAKMKTASDKNTYEGLRNLAFSIVPSQLKIAIPDNENLVYGVVIDLNMGDSFVTLVSFITGATSLYISTGDGIIGGGKSPSVGEAASELVTMSQNYTDRAIPVSTFDLPAKGCVRFYLLTNHQKLAAQENVVHFDDNTSAWLPLFEKANEVIAEMRAGLN